MGREENHNTKHEVQVVCSAKTSKHILLTYSRYLHWGSTNERTIIFIPTRDRLRGNLPFPVRSPPCIDQPDLAPSEPYQPVNPGGRCNGSRVCGDSLLLVGQDRELGE